jgi:fatty-acyl-CoA synthase
VFAVAAPERADAVDAAAISAFLQDKFETWQMPKQADIHFIDAIPKTAVGKFDKKALRRRLTVM